MTDFNRDYLRLLRDQVETEMRFLNNLRHNVLPIKQPCIFCNQVEQSYFCTRLKELKEFLSQIVVRQQTAKVENDSHFTNFTDNSVFSDFTNTL